MQGLHHQQQQLAALLSAALPKDSSSTSTTTTTTTTTPPPSSSTSTTTTTASATSTKDNDGNDAARLAALDSLHRAILYPPNSLLVSHSAAFLSQGLSQLLSDKSYTVRQSAATSYGALCAVVCSIPTGANGRQKHVLGGLIDGFIGWALPLVSNVSAGDGTAELVLESLREFLSIGDVDGIERYVLPILKACQRLLEDDRTSFALLRRLLGILNLISVKFLRYFQPHFLDIIDLLLGWVLVPDLAESDRRLILDNFLQFQQHWFANLQFSMGLLSKFINDMDVLLQDGSPGTPSQHGRLLVLLSCFSTILQSTASGLLEMNLLEQISESLGNMLPPLLGSLSNIGKKLGWSKWIADLWKCLTLLAEILAESFSKFYPLVVDVLFQCLDLNRKTQHMSEKLTSSQVRGVIKTNLQLLSLQKHGLLPSSVKKVLEFDAPISKLRLHPNHLVTGSSAATYVFFFQHGNDEVVKGAISVLMDELDLLKGMLEKALHLGDEDIDGKNPTPYSKDELFALVKFDLKVLLTCISLVRNNDLIACPDIAVLYLERAGKLITYIRDAQNPFELPIQAYVELQVHVTRTIHRLAAVEFLSMWSLRNQINKNSYLDVTDKVYISKSSMDWLTAIIDEYMGKYNVILVKGLDVHSPLEVKLLALEWICRFCEDLIANDGSLNGHVFESRGHIDSVVNILFSVLVSASDREPKVRSSVPGVLELLLQARLVDASYFYCLTETVFERLGDPDTDIRSSFVRLAALVFPVTMFACGLYEHGTVNKFSPTAHISNLHWKLILALKQLPQQLSSQQFVSILSFISQGWKVPLSSWIQRLIHGGWSSKEGISGLLEETGKIGPNVPWLNVKLDEDFLERVCSVNHVAGAFWAVHEAARFCVAIRLRTNLGGPSQTFAALERMLLDMALVLHLDAEQNDGNLSIVGSSRAHLLPMRLLLDFVEALKKNVHNAYEGSAILPSVTGQSSLFFRTNKKVCEEWFSRICEPMMNAGLALHCHYAVIQYSTLRLQELKNLLASALKEKPRGQASDSIHNIRDKFYGDILKVLRHMALALCRCHEPEALFGLQQWVSTTFSFLLVDGIGSSDNSRISGPFAWISGLAYQADCQYERAAAHFTHLLQDDESLSSLGSDGVQFVIARTIESYTAVSDWRSLESWLAELQILRSRHAGRSYSGALTTAGHEINAIHALARFDEGNVHAAWSYLDLTPKSSSELTLDPQVALQRSEQMLLQAMLRFTEEKMDQVPQEIYKAKSMLEEALSTLPIDGLIEAAPYAVQLHCILASEEGHRLKGNLVPTSLQQSVLTMYIESLESHMNEGHQDCDLWLKILRVYRTNFPTNVVTFKLCMSLSGLARKQKNLLLANRLNNYLRDHMVSCSVERYHSFLQSNLQYEELLLLHAEKKYETALTNLWSFLRPCMVSSISVVSDSDDGVFKAKACLKLSNWLRKNLPDMSKEHIVHNMMADFMTENTSICGRIGQNVENFSSKPSLDVVIEEIVGTATKLSTQLCSTMGKSWMCYASWCLNQAKASLSNSNKAALRSCTFSHALHAHVLPERFMLTEDERTSVQSVLLNLFHQENIASNNYGAYALELLTDSSAGSTFLQQVIDTIEAAAGAPGAESLGGEPLSRTLGDQLRTSFLQEDPYLEQSKLSSAVHKLVTIWWSLRKRRVSLFGTAANSFMQYLKYSSVNLSDYKLAGSHYESHKQNHGSYVLRATLYVLHIVLNFGVELKDTIEPALSTIPLLPWQKVTPQVFARFSSHPEQVVRKQLEGLLMMLAKLSPWSIVFPTLVDVRANEDNISEELQSVLGRLRALYPRLVHDVQLMMNELENVTVLWEELWLGTLQDLHADVIRRLNVLKVEAARTADNATLSHREKNMINAAKYSAMMAPIVVALERRLVSTSRKPETPHETWFYKEYREKLKSAILAFKTPPASVAALGDVWRPFDDIAASLAAYQRKSSLSLCEVAPQLALMSTSDVPMPGFENQLTLSEPENVPSTTLQGLVTISSFSDEVSILSTKTKPKKIVIVGSDGKKYTYLLKGREDLRLDARVMQLLEAVNGLLHSNSLTRRQLLAIRNYTVTPISSRAGLIQWVDNVISIYSLFKSWQTRLQLNQHSVISPGDGKNFVAPPVPRPSDMFYGKIIPALKGKGIRRVISRRDWPHDVKRKVLLDLMKEVPRQLLHQELWCASEGFKAFSSKMKRYTGSVAVMSMVGHILGLGDRHLDNILVDFSNGDIVHIDYNVCFDKGLRLKIPEIVPFRLTQIIEAGLGLTGVEGTFKANCEAVVRVLRKNKDILLMLLEAFVWDPLVEWTRGDFHDEAAIGGEELKGMELAVSLSLFASRVQEIRVPLQEHHDLLLASLPAVEYALEKFSDLMNQYEVISARFHQADQERSRLIVLEKSAKSVVAEVTSNLEKIHALYEVQAREFTLSEAVLSEKAQEAATLRDRHGAILDALHSNLLPEINSCLKLAGVLDAFSLRSAVPEAGVPLTVVPEPTQVKCQEIDREISHVISELDDGLSSALTGIQAYSLTLQRILPLNYPTTSAIYGWAQVLRLSTNILSSDILAIARRQAAELMSRASVDDLESIVRCHEDLCLKVDMYAIEIEKVEKECAELINSVGSVTKSNTKDQLLSAFTNYLLSVGLVRREDDYSSDRSGQSKYGQTGNIRISGGLEDEQKISSLLNTAVIGMNNDVRQKVVEIAGHSVGEKNQGDKSVAFFTDLEGQVEKCVLLAEFIGELQYLCQQVSTQTDAGTSNFYSERNLASIFKNSLISCKNLVGQMTEVVLPDVMRSAVSSNSELMNTFGLISQIRGSIDTALEQLVEIQLERASLAELEKNYFVKVGLITEQQLALEEAAVKGRDHLSWEEAEELASQEEACRAQLDRLNQIWNQREMRTSTLIKREADIRSALISSEHHLQSLINAEEPRKPHVSGSKVMLAMLFKPFSQMEALDNSFSSLCDYAVSYLDGTTVLAELMSSGYSLSQHIWKFGGILNSQSFFIWKVCVVDSLVDSCIHDTASSVDQNLGFDQLLNLTRKKIELQLLEHIHQYLKERVAPAFLAWLDKENEHSKQSTELIKLHDLINKDAGAVSKVQCMLDECCSAHETARAARSAASVMKRQVNELKEALCKVSLELIQLEWIYDVLKPSHKSRVTFQKFLSTEDNLRPIILNLSRPKLLEGMQSAVKKISESMECLQTCEQSSTTAESQLERAMEWACGGPNLGSTGSLSTKASGIPPEFHNHLITRRQLLHEAREKATDIVKVCTSILEFEASRDGIFLIPGDIHIPRTGVDGRTWQQTYFNALAKLEIAYHSFTRTEQEWKLAKSNMEVASNGLHSTTTELCIASLRAKSASDDLQSIVLSLRDCAYAVNVALSGFARVFRGHTALTSESSTMLEEILAITEDLHDVHTLGKEAAAVHRSLMEDLSKANVILLPLESIMSEDVAVMTDVMTKEKETKSEVSPIHGQAIYDSYSLRTREAIQAFKPLVPSITLSVNKLYSMLMRLAQTVGLHAGHLHKVLEGPAESEDTNSPGIKLSGTDVESGANEFDDKRREDLTGLDTGSTEVVLGDAQDSWRDKGWISPPDSVHSCRSESGITSSEASLADSFNATDEVTVQDLHQSDSRGTADCQNSLPSSQIDYPEISYKETRACNDGSIGALYAKDGQDQRPLLTPSEHPPGASMPRNETLKEKVEGRNANISTLNKIKVEDQKGAASSSDTRVPRGKNSYAMSVLKRVEMKFEGQDIAKDRKIGVDEQVDFLIKQAMSVDNLCNMYEGWTPWI